MLGRSKASKQSFDIPGTTQHGPFKVWRPDSRLTDSEAGLRSSHRPPTTRVSGSASDTPRASKLFKVTKSAEGGHGPVDSKAKRISVRHTASEVGHGTRLPTYQTDQYIPPVPPLPSSVYGNMTAGGLVDDRTPSTSASSSRNSSSDYLPSTEAHGRPRNAVHQVMSSVTGYQSLKIPSAGHISDSAVKSSLRPKLPSMTSRVPPPYDGYISPSPSQKQQQPRPAARGPPDRKPVNQGITALPSNSKPAGTAKLHPKRKPPKPSPPPVGRQVNSDGEWSWSLISPPTSLYMALPDSQPSSSTIRAPESFAPVKEPQKERSNRSAGHGWFGSLGRRYAADEDNARKQSGHRAHASVDSGNLTHKLPSKPPVSGRHKLFSTHASRKSDDTLPIAGNTSAGEDSLHSPASRTSAKKVLSEDTASKKGKNSDDSHHLPSLIKAAENSHVVSGLRNLFSRGKADDASSKYGSSPHVSNDSLRVDSRSTAPTRPSHGRSESSPWSFSQFRYRSTQTMAGPASSVETISKPSGSKPSLFKSSKSPKRKPVPDAASLKSPSKEAFPKPLTPNKDSAAKPFAGRSNVEPAMPLPSMVAAASASNTARRRPPPPHPRGPRDSPPNSQPKTSPSGLEAQEDDIVLESRQRPFSVRPSANPNTSLEDPVAASFIVPSASMAVVTPAVSLLQADLQTVSDSQHNSVNRRTPSPPNPALNHDTNVSTGLPAPIPNTPAPSLATTKPIHTAIPSPAVRSAAPSRPSLLRSTPNNAIPDDMNNNEDNSLDDDKDPLATPSSLDSLPPPPTNMSSLDYRRQTAAPGYIMRNQGAAGTNPQEIWLPPSLQLGASVDSRETMPLGPAEAVTGTSGMTRPSHRMSTSRPFTKRVPINSWVESAPQMTTVALQAAGQPGMPPPRPPFPFRLTSAAQNRSISAASMEAVVGAALSSHPPTPGSIHMDMPRPPSPPTRHPALGVEEWRRQEQDDIHVSGRTRRRRPGVTFDFPDDGKLLNSSRQQFVQVESIIAE